MIRDEASDPRERVIADRLGLAFTPARRPEMLRLVAQAARDAGAGDVETYLAGLASMPDDHPEWSRLAAYLTVGETYFFRDRACFDALSQQVLPTLIEARRRAGDLRLGLWSAGCATGEEPYSLAILLDSLLPDLRDWAVTILATDISGAALAHARRAAYREWSFRETPELIRQRHFSRGPDRRWRLTDDLHQLVRFDVLNLARSSSPPSMPAGIDVVFCRNVLMYLTPGAQRVAAGRLAGALAPAGWLVTSAVEASPELFHALEPVNFPGAVFFRHVGACAGEAAPRLIGAPRDAPIAASVLTVAAPPDPHDLVAEARVCADAGARDRARALCEQAISRDRLAVEPYLLLATIHQECGNASAAIDTLQRAIYLAPATTSAHFFLGQLLLQRGDVRRGRRALEAVLDLLRDAEPGAPVADAADLTAGRLVTAVRAQLASVPEDLCR